MCSTPATGSKRRRTLGFDVLFDVEITESEELEENTVTALEIDGVLSHSFARLLSINEHLGELDGDPWDDDSISQCSDSTIESNSDEYLSSSDESLESNFTSRLVDTTTHVFFINNFCSGLTLKIF